MLTVTIVSLVVAAVSGFIAWRSVRREYLRSDARVALLASAIDASLDRSRTALGDGFEWFDHEAETPVPVTATMDENEDQARRRPLLTVAAGFAVVLAVVVLIAMTGDRYDVSAPPVPARAESLELLSLRAAREGVSLAVTGVVRNRADEPLNAITAIVSAVDAQGRAVGRGQAAVAPLRPGRESRFIVTIAGAGAARYRVSFRGATGVIRHVDLRADRPNDAS